MTPPPIALGLIVCEQVIVDHHTMNPSPISIFSGLAVENFPSPPQRCSVFASLTNGRGDGTLRLVVNRLDTGETIYEQRFPIRFPDPLLVVNVNIRVRGIRFPVPGHYEFLLYVDSDPIAQRTLRVRSIMKGCPLRWPDTIMQPQKGSAPQPDPRDELAGIYLRIEAEEQVFLPPDVGEPRPQREPGWTPPTTDELAGIYVYIEAEEKIFLPPDVPPESKPSDSSAQS